MTYTRLLHVLALSLVIGSACDDGGDEDDDDGGGEDNPRTAGILELTGTATPAGADVFAATCGTAPCHGADGNTPGDPMMLAKDLSEEIPEKTDREIVNIILNGYETMASQATLSDQQVADVLAYVRGEFG